MTEFPICLNGRVILETLGCRPGCEQWKEWMEEYRIVEEQARKLLAPFAVLRADRFHNEFKTDQIPEHSEVCYCLEGVGGKITRYIEKSLEQGHYMSGMLANAIADYYLFEMDKIVLSHLTAMCQEQGKGILKRLEVPEDIPFEASGVILSKCDEELSCRLAVTKHFMYHPPKSMGFLYLLTDRADQVLAEPSCSRCKRKDCYMRKTKENSVRVTVLEHNKESVLFLDSQENLMEALLREGFFVNHSCGGRGNCGKCRFRCQSWLPVTSADQAFFTEEELNNGWRLACAAGPREDCTIELWGENEDKMEAIAEFYDKKEDRGKAEGKDKAAYLIGIDIGTTTLAFQAVDGATYKNAAVHTSLNHQRRFGADVVTRIQASLEGKTAVLSSAVRDDIISGLEALERKGKFKRSDIEAIAIAGNTTMIHLLMGYSCEPLSKYPFSPVHTEEMKLSFKDLFPDQDFNIPVTILPGISAFVGADITAGLLACDFGQSDQTDLFIDIGTNGEMAAGTSRQVFCTSTAAGPAFEGGNISRGTGSVPGAIAGAVVRGNRIILKTIEDKIPPAGICGTGVIELAAELLKEGILDHTGRMTDPYRREGYLVSYDDRGGKIFFTQQDVRELQTAKSAVRAGIEVLLEQAGIKAKEVGKVFLAGGFGYKINLKKAADIGLLPIEWTEKIQPAGNSSLKGAVDYLIRPDSKEKAKALITKAKEIHLSNETSFPSLYMKYLNF